MLTSFWETLTCQRHRLAKRNDHGATIFQVSVVDSGLYPPLSLFFHFLSYKKEMPYCIQTWQWKIDDFPIHMPRFVRRIPQRAMSDFSPKGPQGVCKTSNMNYRKTHEPYHVIIDINYHYK